MLAALDIDVTALLAVGGVGGVAVSFGAQRVVGNILSGLLIFVTQPFKTGQGPRHPSIHTNHTPCFARLYAFIHAQITDLRR